LANLVVIARRQGEPVAERRHLARQLLLEAEALPEGEWQWLRPWALTVLANVEAEALNLREARSLAEERRAVALARNANEDVMAALSTLAGLDVIEGRVDHGLDAMRRLADDARAATAEAAALNCYRDAAWLAMRSLDYGQAKLRLDDGLRFSDEVEQSHCGHM